MKLPLSTVRRKVRTPLGIGGPDGLDQSKMDDIRIDEYVNLSYQDLLDKFAFREKEVVATTSTAVGKRIYAMPDPYDALRQIDILEPNTLQHRRIDPMSVDHYTSVFTEEVSKRGFPTHYVRESCQFYLHPIPDNIYTLVVRYWGVLADLSDPTQTISVPSVWMEPIIYGAVYRAFLDLGDINRAEYFQNQQARMVNSIAPTQTKEEEDYHRAGVEVLGREY